MGIEYHETSSREQNVLFFHCRIIYTNLVYFFMLKNRSRTLMRKQRYSFEEEISVNRIKGDFGSPRPDNSRAKQRSFVPVIKVKKRSEANSPVGRLAKKSVPRKMRSGASAVEAPFSRAGNYYTTVASYKEELVAVKMVTKKEINMDRSFLMQMRNVSEPLSVICKISKNCFNIPTHRLHFTSKLQVSISPASFLKKIQDKRA